MTGAHGELFEYWAHAACLLPVADEPLFRWRMAQHGPYGDRPLIANAACGVARRKRRRTSRRCSRRCASAARSPRRQLTDPQRRDGEWWDRRSVGRQALEALFADGQLVGLAHAELRARLRPPRARRSPSGPCAADTDDGRSARALLLRAAQYLGVATAGDLAYYYMINPRAAKARVAALAASGRLAEVRVEGWRDRAYMLPGTRVTRPRREHATLLSPFDSLIWERARTSRLFGFDYTIEVYVPEPKRKYGYYVLPMLLGDELVARFDLKADRKTSTLLVRGSYLEPGANAEAVAPAASAELHALRTWLGLDDLVVAKRGNLASALRRMR